jgi:small subunit ribosomal protein S20
MPNIRSNEKAVRKSEKRNEANRAKRNVVRLARRGLLAAVATGDLSKSQQALSKFASSADRAAKTGALAKNTASRLKSRMAARVAALAKK